ncbi:MAG: aminopeptidase [Candidatus Aminicenantales bacterium]
MNKLDRAARKAISQCLKLKPTDKFLLVTDEAKLEIAEALAAWARRSRAETTVYLMAEALRPISEPTGLFREMASRATAMAYVLESRLEEKPFRSFMVSSARRRGRILMMPGLTREMMERLVNLDYTKMISFTRRLARVLQDAAEVEVENPDGTHLAFSLKGRAWNLSLGDISRRGSHGNLPAGECYTAPVEETFSGRLVLRLIDDKVGRGVMDFKRGRLVRWSGKGVAEVVRLIGSDRSGFIIGEFGIGTNPGARLCPNMLEAEKALGTVHFAIGDSYGLGRNQSRHHYDALAVKPTIRVRGRVIARHGKFLI